MDISLYLREDNLLLNQLYLNYSILMLNDL